MDYCLHLRNMVCAEWLCKLPREFEPIGKERTILNEYEVDLNSAVARGGAWGARAPPQFFRKK